MCKLNFLHTWMYKSFKKVYFVYPNSKNLDAAKKISFWMTRFLITQSRRCYLKGKKRGTQRGVGSSKIKNLKYKKQEGIKIEPTRPKKKERGRGLMIWWIGSLPLGCILNARPIFPYNFTRCTLSSKNGKKSKKTKKKLGEESELHYWIEKSNRVVWCSECCSSMDSPEASQINNISSSSSLSSTLNPSDESPQVQVYIISYQLIN